MMNYNDEEEQLVAARTIWNLSFDQDVNEKIMEEPECLTALEKLTVSSNKALNKMAEGALWKIKGEGNKRAPAYVGKYDDHVQFCKCDFNIWIKKRDSRFVLNRFIGVEIN